MLEYEEMWWSKRARIMWLKHEGMHTKFFHLKASQRRRPVQGRVTYIAKK